MSLPFVTWDVYLSEPTPQWLGTVYAQPAPLGKPVDYVARNVAIYEFMTQIRFDDYSVNPRDYTLEELEEMRRSV